MIRTCFFGRGHKGNLHCVSSEISPQDVVGTTCWLKLRAGATKEADAKAVTRGVNLAGRAGNRGNLDRTIL
jgi:hypothetical protein